MRVCMILHDPQPFGGIEEYAVTLASALQQAGNAVSILSTTWIPPDNQYAERLRQAGIPLIQVPKRLSRLSSHWATKLRVLNVGMGFLTPLSWVLAAAVWLLRRRAWDQARHSARSWLRNLILSRLLARNYYRPLSLWLLAYWKTRWRPDVLHIHGYAANLLHILPWARARGVPTVYEEHQTPDAQFDWWDGSAGMIDQATRIVAVSDKSAEGLRHVCRVSKHINVVKRPMADPCGEEGAGEEPVRRKRQPSLVATVVRLVEAKGLTYFLEAVASLRPEYPTVSFKVYGEGPLRDELLEYAKRLGLDGKEIFAGAFSTRSELDRILRLTDIFVLPSVLEGQPLALVEAMAYGCPIVATAVGGVPELIRHGVNGLLCPPGEGPPLAEAIARLLRDADLRAALGGAARASFKAGPFSPMAAAATVQAIYAEAVKIERRRLGHDDR